MDSIIFDVDGTLWDSTEIVARSWDAYLRQKEHLNISVTSERLMRLFGQTLSAIAAQLFPDMPKSEQLRLIDGCCQAEHEALLETCAPLYKDLEETLKYLSEKYPLYIVSNCQAGYIEVFLKTSGLGRYFKGHLCFGDTGLEKNDTLLRLIELHNLKSPVYVGDTMGDFLACRKAEVPFVFASYGFGEVPEPDFRISSLPDLTTLF